MKLKVGNKVVFDWTSEYHKRNSSTITVKKINELYGLCTNRTFLVSEIRGSYCKVQDFEFEINMARLKKVNTWSINVRRKNKYFTRTG